MTTLTPKFETRRTEPSDDTIRKILVGADFSENTTDALNWATELARSLRAGLALVHAIESDLPALAQAQENLSQKVRQRLDSLHAPIGGESAPQPALGRSRLGDGD